MTKKIIALATCYNRCSLTIKALKSILSQKISEDYHISICIVDDGSTDNTSVVVKEIFPEVKILHGDGNLYWAGGMLFGWNNFVKTQSFDYLLVFNDDINLYEFALDNLIQTAQYLEQKGEKKYIVVGGFKDSETDTTAYSAVVRKSFWHPLRFQKINPSNFIIYGDTLNMNFALISKGAIDSIGFFSEEFTHGKADFDFGLRLKSKGGIIALAPNYIGECAVNPLGKFFSDPSISIEEKWQKLISIKHEPPKERALYYRRHGGYLWFLFWVLPYLRIGSQRYFKKLIMILRQKKQ